MDNRKMKNELISVNEAIENIYEACIYRKEMKNPNKVLDYIQNIAKKTRNKFMD